MTERTFLAWLKKAGMKWKPFLDMGDEIRLRTDKYGDCVCPLEAVQALKFGTPADECEYRKAHKLLRPPFSRRDLLAAADCKTRGELRAKMLKALGLKEAKP